MQQPNSVATKNAGRVLAKVEELVLAHLVQTSMDDGICISFRRHDRYADIECFNTGEILAAMKIDGEEPAIWEISPENIGETVVKIKLFISGVESSMMI